MFKLDIYFHNREQLFFSNRNNVFGSVRHSLHPSMHESKELQGSSSYVSVLELNKVEERSLDKPGEPCIERIEARNKSVGRCITESIEKVIGCRS